MTFLRNLDLPICFTKQELSFLFTGTPRALKGRIDYALKKDQLLQLKNGLYMKSTTYLHEPNKTELAKFIASQLYEPSYISLEYALETYHLLLSRGPITSVTPKTNRTFTNFCGTFTYSHVKLLLFCGFEERSFGNHTYRIATKGKALFDYLYLRSDLHRRNLKLLKHQLFHELGIQWMHFSEEDFQEFDRYVWKSNSSKMMKVWHILDEYFAGKKFDRWAKELLA